MGGVVSKRRCARYETAKSRSRTSKSLWSLWGTGETASSHGRSFFFQAEDGIRDVAVTGVQTCALPIWRAPRPGFRESRHPRHNAGASAPDDDPRTVDSSSGPLVEKHIKRYDPAVPRDDEIGRASCRERV